MSVKIQAAIVKPLFGVRSTHDRDNKRLDSQRLWSLQTGELIRVFETSPYWFADAIANTSEAGLAEAYTAVESTLNLHTIFGWSLSGVICAVTAWRYVWRSGSILLAPYFP
ncbi:DUF2231 domain-containing protein [Chamaesiphon minutus]|uniref:Putative membrane protein (DUF2231) n=1 Tax=Chamaesiphon minutus (strain ATCC 27169 / PCC 6605) TaxID=1173020 RepID=K9UCE9_CHAP6|nr:DUF2231 domain-containing protein [Chamaesiphon minutus]AFY92515.1 putative membrane protein (DUF2231) [Chamaesiphon minutus PCC 6605]